MPPRVLGVVVLLAAAGSLALLTDPSAGQSATTATSDPYRAPLAVDTNPDPKIVETTITARPCERSTSRATRRRR